ncbi:BA75_02201T0 [Komagataella pastoris]|uniref:BA75_02201T0 n=1 Tax=Komagataella pastoris TaxID=4922 RepID=A0A1B2JBV2_PICPA|nr:BA75_02201T0 [Komagataella pastoris]
MSKLQLEVRIIPPSVRELEDQILTQSYLISREPVQNPNSSFSLSLQSTTLPPQPLYQYPINLHPNVVRFVHLTLFSNNLSTIAEEISQRFLKLHPDQDPLEIERLENSFGTDLDPDYVAEEIFNRDNLIRVIVDKEIVTRKRSQSPQPFHNSLVLPRKRAKSSSLKTPNTTLQSPSRHPLAEEINANSTAVFVNVDPTKPNSPATNSTPIILNNSTRKVSERITSGMLTADMPNLSNNDIPSTEENFSQKDNEPKQASVPSKETVQMNKKANTAETSVTTSPSKLSSFKVAEKSPSPTGENSVTLTKEDVFRFFKSGIRNSTANDTDLEDTFSSYKPARFSSTRQNGSGLATDEAASSKNHQHSAVEPDTAPSSQPEPSSTLTKSSAPKVVTALAPGTSHTPRSLRSINANSKVANSSVGKEQFEADQEKNLSSLSKEESSQKAAEEESSRKLQAEERRRLQEEKRQLQHEEKLRKDEARRRAREERDRSRLEKKAQQEEEKLRRQEERKKLQEEKKKQLEEEKQRKLEEKRKLSEKVRLEEIEQSSNSQSSLTSSAKQNSMQTASSPTNKITTDPARNTVRNSITSPAANNKVSSPNLVKAGDTHELPSSPVKKSISPSKVNPSSTKSLATVSTSSLNDANKNQPSISSSTSARDDSAIKAPVSASRRNVTESSSSHQKISSEKSSGTKASPDNDQDESSSESDSTSDSSDSSESESNSNSETDTSSDSEGSGSEEEKREKKAGTVSKRPIVVNTPATRTLASSSKPTLQARAATKSSQTPAKKQNPSSSASAKATDTSVLPVKKKEPSLAGVSSLPKLTQLMERGVPAVRDTTANSSFSNKKPTPRRRVKSDAIIEDSDLSSSSSSDSTSGSDSDSDSSSDSDSASGNNSSSDDPSDSESESDGNKALSSQFLNSRKAKELIGKKKKSSALSSLLKDTKK